MYIFIYQGKTTYFSKPTTQRKARPRLYDLKMAHCVMVLKIGKIDRMHSDEHPWAFFTAASCSRTAVVPVAPPWKVAKAAWRDESEKLWKSFSNGVNPARSTHLISLTCVYLRYKSAGLVGVSVACLRCAFASMAQAGADSVYGTCSYFA